MKKIELFPTDFTKVKKIALDLLHHKNFIQFTIIFLLFCMFPLGYLESLQWPLPGPKATHGILKGLFLILGAVLILGRQQLKPAKRPILNLLMLLFVLAYTLSAAFSQAPGSSLLNLWYPFISLAVIFAFSKIELNKNLHYIFIIFSVFLVFCTFTFSFFSLMFRYSVDNIYYFLFLEHRANHLLSELRQYGKYVSLGPYLFLVPILSSFLVRKSATLSRKLLSLLVVFVSLLTAVISNNRIDALIISIHMVALLFLIPRKLAVALMLAAIPIVAVGLTTTEKYFGFSLEERILRPKVERDQETITIRFTYWQTALYNFQHFPIFGTGPNTYNDVSIFPLRRYYDPGTNEYLVKFDEGIGIHNVFFERLSDTGLVGFITFMLLLFYFLRMDVIAILSRKSLEEKKIYFLYALSSWTWILYGITDNGYGAQGFLTFFFLRGLILHI